MYICEELGKCLELDDIVLLVMIKRGIKRDFK